MLFGSLFAKRSKRDAVDQACRAGQHLLANVPQALASEAVTSFEASRYGPLSRAMHDFVEASLNGLLSPGWVHPTMSSDRGRLSMPERARMYFARPRNARALRAEKYLSASARALMPVASTVTM